jgi:transposase-like protein
MPARPTAAPRLPCPNPACAAPHVVRNGSIKGRQRYHCRGCGAWFGATHGTPLYRLHTPPEEIARALLIAMRRGSLRAAEEVTGHKYETISHWLQLAANHAEALTAVPVRDLQLSTLEVDEFWSFVKRKRATSPRVTRPRSATAGAA